MDPNVLPKIAKLPRWAQEHIEAISRECNQLRLLNQELKDHLAYANPKTNVHIHRYDKQLWYLPENGPIRFLDKLDVQLRPVGDKLVLEVCAVDSAAATIYVEPRVNNVVHIHCARWDALTPVGQPKREDT